MSQAQVQAPRPPSTPDFVAAAAQSGAFEILCAHTAMTASHNPQVREFAQHMLQDHTRLGEDLRRAATEAGLPPPPPGISAEQSMMLNSLQSQRGAEFDKVYAMQQALAHQSALVVAQSYAGGGQEPAIRRAAEASVPVIQRHLQMAEQLHAAVGGA